MFQTDSSKDENKANAEKTVMTMKTIQYSVR